MSTTILKARWLLTMTPGSEVLNEHALVMQGERIAAILPWAEAEAQFPDAERVELGQHVLIPGLINGHTHSAMSLLRGVADDVPLMDWLNNHIWPLEKKWVSEDWTYQGSLLSAAEPCEVASPTSMTCISSRPPWPAPRWIRASVPGCPSM